MDMEKFKRDYWRTLGHIQTATLGAGGWDVKVLDAALVAQKQVFLYYFDRSTEFVWMAGIPIALFQKLGEFVKSQNEKDIQLLRDSVQHFTVEAISLGAKLNWSETEEQLGVSLAAYAWTTQTIEIASGLKEGGHFFVINYRKNGDKKHGKLRPFCLVDESGEPLSVSDLMETLQSAMNVDKVNHPEWFK